jgi:hypothetical protein
MTRTREQPRNREITLHQDIDLSFWNEEFNGWSGGVESFLI